MTDEELQLYDSYTTLSNKFFVPAVWAAAVVSRARRDGRIKFDVACDQIIKVCLRHVSWYR